MERRLSRIRGSCFLQSSGEGYASHHWSRTVGLQSGKAGEVAGGGDEATLETGGALADKPRVTVLNKADALDEELTEMQRASLEEAVGHPVLVMSGAAGKGVREVLRALHPHVKRARGLPVGNEDAEADADGDAPWHP